MEDSYTVDDTHTRIMNI